MSWGERSCLQPCRCEHKRTISSCNVNCGEYIWDEKTEPDSIPIHSRVNIVKDPIIEYRTKVLGNRKKRRQDKKNRMRRLRKNKSK